MGNEAVEFNEKPTVPTGFVSGEVFVFQREVFEYLGDDPNLLIECEPLQRLAKHGQLTVYPHEGVLDRGCWTGMDTYRDFKALNELWSRGDSPWKVWDG